MRGAGRILGVDGTRVLIVSSGGRTWLEVTPEIALAPGDWVQWQKETDGPARLAFVQKAPEPRGDGEVARFLLGEKGAHLRERHRALRILRDHFDGRGFLEVDTPAVVPCPGLDSHVHSLGEVQSERSFGYLRTSPELHMKRLLVGGFDKIYQIAPCYRSEEQGTWHEPEFTMVEWYEAFAGFEDLLRSTEELVRHLCLTLTERGELRRGDRPGSVASVQGPFERISVEEAFSEFAEQRDVVDLAEAQPELYFELLATRIEPELARLPRPVFLYHYPLSQAALATPVPGAPEFAERAELYALGIELSNGFAELTEPAEQRRRFVQEQERRQSAGEPVYPLDERFLSALEEGMPTSIGNALGFDRLLALCLGSRGIAQVMAFSSQEK